MTSGGPVTDDGVIDRYGSRVAADTHDVVEVRGARENNLADILVDIPKRRRTG